MDTLENTLRESGTLMQQYLEVRKQTINLCIPLKVEDYVVQPTGDVSPPKWHLGHTTWFFENFVLKPYKRGYQLFHKEYNYVFNSYYESEGKRVLKTDRGNLTRPTVEEVMAYRNYVDDNMRQFLEREKEIPEKAKEILTLGLQHEQQHQELLVYDIKYILGNNPLFPTYLEQEEIDFPDHLKKSFETEEHYLSIDGGLYEIGHDGEGFCFDNELGKHKVYLHDFQVQDRLITNGEYIEFIVDGGYDNFKYWLSEGWQWVQGNNVKAPLYWDFKDGDWYNYTLQGLKKVDITAPVTHVSFYEADAFACWRGKRLPTEFEWEVACKIYASSIPSRANFLEQGKMAPVASQGNNFQFYGDVWEWTGSAYRPYPYFKAKEGSLGEYNGKFMINQMVLRGGSCATPRNHIRATYRNFFQPHLRWHFTGIRLAEST